MEKGDGEKDVTKRRQREIIRYRIAKIRKRVYAEVKYGKKI